MLPDLRPSWAASSQDQGAAPGGAQVAFRVYLRSGDAAGLEAYAREVSDPSDPCYRQFLDPAAVQRRYGPGQDERAAAERWLGEAGLSVDAGDGDAVVARGTVAQAEAAFGVSFHDYRHEGRALALPAGELSVPAELGGDVTTVSGLGADELDQDAAAAPSPSPEGQCSAYFGEKEATDLPPAYGQTVPWGGCGYTPAQQRSAYGVTRAGLDGRGSKVAIVLHGSNPDILADANAYARSMGDAPFAPGQLSQDILCVDASDCAQPTSEEVLDVEAVHAMAPAADVTYVGASAKGNGPLDGLAYVVDHHSADIVSDSWTLAQLEPSVPADTLAAYDQVFQEGAAEGIGFYFASGDSGDSSRWPPRFGGDGAAHATFPDADPWVTSVGGTTLAVGRDGQYEWETSWGDHLSALAGDGSGWSDPPATSPQVAGEASASASRSPGISAGWCPTR